ncbi:MAG: BCD family MFS transporter, partial [Pseudomonadota bacterium]
MKSLNHTLAQGWRLLDARYLPFADAASADLPLGRLLRLSLFQVSVGMALVLLSGTLNRVMIIELSVPSWLVALMVSLPLLFAPLRALIGFRSDHHRSYLGWRRVPYIWFGSLLQFGGLAIMPFALIVLSGDANGPLWIGYAASALAFLMIGAGLHTTQTAGLALATDLAPKESRPRVVAFLYMMLLIGMVAAALAFGWLLGNFSQLRLIQLIQGAAVLTMLLNCVALWKQEAREPRRTDPRLPKVSFLAAWRKFRAGGRAGRVLLVIGLGTAAFSMQDILLEPYGGEVLNLSVGATTALTALLAGGTICAFALSAAFLSRGVDPYRLAGFGAVIGILAFSAVILSAPLDSTGLFRVGTALLGFGAGMFAVGTLTGAMELADDGNSGLALGAWGSVQATSMGLAIATGGFIRDAVTGLADASLLGPALTGPAVGYGVVYQLEILLLIATLVAIGPLVRLQRKATRQSPQSFGLA